MLISAPYEHGASFGGGASRGPAAIVACLDRQIELFERHTRTEPAYHYRIAHRELAELERAGARGDGRRGSPRRCRDAPFTVLLGGIHSVTIGALEAHAAAPRRGRGHRACRSTPISTCATTMPTTTTTIRAATRTPA